MKKFPFVKGKVAVAKFATATWVILFCRFFLALLADHNRHKTEAAQDHQADEQRAVAVVLDIHGYGVFPGIVGHALVYVIDRTVRNPFNHGVGVVVGFRVFNLLEDDGVAVVGAFGHFRGVFIDIEEELTAIKISAAQFLRAFQYQMGAADRVAVNKRELICIFIHIVAVYCVAYLQGTFPVIRKR